LLIINGDFSEESGYLAMKRLLPLKPEAIFAASDTMAIGAIRAVREAGLRVPEDIAFVGFDDLPIASLSDFKLTTVHQPIIQFGAKAVDTLIDLIENGIKPSRRIIMDTELIIRDSCGASQKNCNIVKPLTVNANGSALTSKRHFSPYQQEEVEKYPKY
jgi:LacI family transcriptional regulator